MRVVVALATCLLAVGLAGCEGDHVVGAPVGATDQPTTAVTTATTQPQAPRGDPLGGKDPCGLVDKATLERLAGTPVLSMAPMDPARVPDGVGCSINDDEPGVTMELQFYRAGKHGRANSLPGATKRSQDSVTIPGAKEAWLTRAARGQPEAEVCAVAGIVTCAYSTAQFRTAAQLETTSTELAKLLVAAV